MAADHRRVGVVCLADIVAQRAQRDGRFRQLAHARGLDDEASTADVKALVRKYCEASGLDWSSLQVQESAARALIRASDAEGVPGGNDADVGRGGSGDSIDDASNDDDASAAAPMTRVFEFATDAPLGVTIRGLHVIGLVPGAQAERLGVAVGMEFVRVGATEADSYETVLGAIRAAAARGGAGGHFEVELRPPPPPR